MTTMYSLGPEHARRNDPEVRAFVLARIREERAELQKRSDLDIPVRAGRILACDAKTISFGYVEFTGDGLLREAAKYADHPDYRQEWKP